MNILHGLNASLLLPPLALQQLFHAVIWLAVLSWLGVQCLPSYDRRWRWVMCSAAALLVLLVWHSQSFLESALDGVKSQCARTHCHW